MSFDKYLKDAVRDEVARAIAPLASAVDQLRAQGLIINRLGAALGAPGRPGRPAKLATLAKARRGPKAVAEGKRVCALEDCGRPARSKGYCAAHYQKYRMLERSGRLPADWAEFAPEGSVKNVTLPRGRAGAKALAEARKKSKG